MKRTLVLLLCAAALLAGCKKPEDKFAGKWNGTTTYDQAMVDNALSFLPADQRNKAMAQIDPGAMVLNLNRNGNYRLTSNADQNGITGTWILAEDMKTITFSPPDLTPEEAEALKKAGKDPATEQKAMLFSVSDDKSTIARSDDVFGVKVTLTFTRAEQQ